MRERERERGIETERERSKTKVIYFIILTISTIVYSTHSKKRAPMMIYHMIIPYAENRERVYSLKSEDQVRRSKRLSTGP